MFTIYNEEDNKFQLAEEPDPFLPNTYADDLKWKFEAQVELIRGKTFKISPVPASKHQQISICLSSEIYNFLSRRLCKVFAAPFDVRLPVKNKKKENEITAVVQMDSFVICDERKTDDRAALVLQIRSSKYFHRGTLIKN